MLSCRCAMMTNQNKKKVKTPRSDSLNQLEFVNSKG